MKLRKLWVVIGSAVAIGVATLPPFLMSWIRGRRKSPRRLRMFQY